MKTTSMTRVGTLLALVILLVLSASAQKQVSSTPKDEIDKAGLISTEALAAQLGAKGQKPLVLYVGPKFLFVQAHIRGAEFIGPASNPESLEQLKKRVASLAKDAAIVIYCGCCPWEHCPNIRPAYSELRKLGYTKVKALDIPKDFGTNWVQKGYPVEKGETSASGQ